MTMAEYNEEDYTDPLALSTLMRTMHNDPMRCGIVLENFDYLQGDGVYDRILITGEASTSTLGSHSPGLNPSTGYLAIECFENVAAFDIHRFTVGRTIQVPAMAHGKCVLMLVDTGASVSCINSEFVNSYSIKTSQVEANWIELASGEKVEVNRVVIGCPLIMGDMKSISDLYVTPLGTFDIILGMDWLAAHGANIDCTGKRVECYDDSGALVVFSGIQ